MYLVFWYITNTKQIVKRNQEGKFICPFSGCRGYSFTAQSRFIEHYKTHPWRTVDTVSLNTRSAVLASTIAPLALSTTPLSATTATHSTQPAPITVEKRIALESNDLKIEYLEDLPYNLAIVSQIGLLICADCNCGIELKSLKESTNPGLYHCKSEHGRGKYTDELGLEILKDLTECKASVYNLKDTCYNPLENSQHGTLLEAIPLIQVFDGFSCNDCVYFCSSQITIDWHCRKEKHTSFTSCFVQQLWNNASYFGVKYVEPTDAEMDQDKAMFLEAFKESKMKVEKMVGAGSREVGHESQMSIQLDISFALNRIQELSFSRVEEPFDFFKTIFSGSTVLANLGAWLLEEWVPYLKSSFQKSSAEMKRMVGSDSGSKGDAEDRGGRYFSLPTTDKTWKTSMDHFALYLMFCFEMSRPVSDLLESDSLDNVDGTAANLFGILLDSTLDQKLSTFLSSATKQLKDFIEILDSLFLQTYSISNGNDWTSSIYAFIILYELKNKRVLEPSFLTHGISEAKFWIR